MDLKEMKFGEIQELAEQMRTLGLVGGGVAQTLKSNPWKIGEKYLIRTVTQTYTGLLTAVHDTELELDKACWIADSGRFHLALQGKWDASAEHEPFPAPIIIGRGAIIDACPLSCALPEAVK